MLQLQFILLAVVAFAFSYSAKLKLFNQLNKSKDFDMSDAISGIINSDLLKRSPTVSVILVKANYEGLDTKDLITKSIPLLKMSRAVRVEDGKNLQNMSNRRRTFSVIFIGRFQSFLQILQQMTKERFNFEGYYLIVLTKGIIPEIQNIFQQLWMKFIFNVNILLEDESEFISLLTFMPFNGYICGDTTPIKTNQFDKGSGKWEFEEFYPKKFKNLFRCPVRVGAFDTTPAVIKKTMKNGSYSLDGYDIELLKEFSKIINFTIDMNFSAEPGSYGEIYENGSSTGTISKVMNNKVDVIIGNYYITESRLTFMSSSSSYYTNPLLLVIPSGAPVAPLAKLMRPFQTTVWILLLGTLVIGIIVISVVSLQSPEVRILVFGRQIQNPFLNLVVGLVGGSQHVLPKRNFSRTLLMFFLLFCLILRSLYLGGLFEFLQTDQREPELATIDEIIEKDYTLYMHYGISKSVQAMKSFKKTKIIDFADYSIYRKKTLDPSFKGVIFITYAQATFLNKINHRNFTYKTCKDHLFSGQVVFLFQKDFYLVGEFNEKLKYLQKAGIIDLWLSKFTDSEFLNFKKPKNGPEIISIQHLFGGFQIYLCGILISLFAFCCEKLSIFNSFIFLKRVLD